MQTADPNIDHFQVLGVERRFDVDLGALERRYKELTRQLHPDRFARADARARRASLQRSVQLNDAWKTLRDARKRAEYIVRLGGIEVGGEEGTTKRGEDGQTQRVPVPQALLLEIMELRESLMDARVEGEHDRVQVMAAEVRVRREGSMDEVARALSAGDLDAAARSLVAVRYYDRFLDEVAAGQDAALEAGHAG